MPDHDGLIGQLLGIPAGEFVRGSTSTPDESPVRRIFLDTYAICETPVTNDQYLRFTDETGHRRPPLLDDDRFSGRDHPVVGVSWHDAGTYCAWLSERSGLSVSLPTEAQWERAARGDEGATYPWGDAPPRPELLNAGGSVGATTPVGSLGIRSPHGLLDCLGNVWEWCTDSYEAGYYAQAPAKNPPGPRAGVCRVTRGGSWRSDLFRATCAHRCFMHPSVRSDRHGFRVAVLLPYRA